MQRILFFCMVLFFAGATVFAAARDIRSQLAPPTTEERAVLAEMLKDMQGETIIPAQKAMMNKDAMPARKEGSYLARRDIERIKKFLKNLISSDDAAEEK